MKLNEKYNIVCEDPMNVVLQERRLITGKDGSKRMEWKDIAYCVNIASALKTVVTREINGSGVETLKQMANMYTDLREYIDEIYLADKAEIIARAKEEAAMIINDAHIEADRIKNKKRRNRWYEGKRL